MEIRHVVVDPIWYAHLEEYLQPEERFVDRTTYGLILYTRNKCIVFDRQEETPREPHS